jgi:mRNA-degrading endonuclease RelE of RelBE toxin-antitoxin system
MNYELIPLPEFERQAKRLQKKYRHLKDDLITLRQVLVANPRAGNAVPGLQNKVYKLRLPSSDLARGKSGGLPSHLLLCRIAHSHLFIDDLSKIRKREYSR